MKYVAIRGGKLAIKASDIMKKNFNALEFRQKMHKENDIYSQMLPFIENAKMGDRDAFIKILRIVSKDIKKGDIKATKKLVEIVQNHDIKIVARDLDELILVAQKYKNHKAHEMLENLYQGL